MGKEEYKDFEKMKRMNYRELASLILWYYLCGME